MKRTWTMIGVCDVRAGFRWYQSLLGIPETAPGHAYWGQILDSDGTVSLCLHEWGAHEHPSLDSPIVRSRASAYFYFSESMISSWRCQERASSSLEPTRSPT
jgi:hypothetical protein